MSFVEGGGSSLNVATLITSSTVLNINSVYFDLSCTYKFKAQIFSSA